MISEYREEYLSRFSERKWSLFMDRLNRRFGVPINFVVNRTPLFVPGSFQRACEEAAIEFTLRLHDPEYLKQSDRALRPDITVPNQPHHASFTSVDFALTRGENGVIVPKLIELQGFPSLMGYQLLYAELLQEHFSIPQELTPINGGLSRREYVRLLHDTILGDYEVDEVVLMEIDPWNQKTCPDFAAVSELVGIDVVDVREVRKEGRELFAPDSTGQMRPVRRVFNRTIVDEVERRGLTLPFGWHDDLDVEWAGHPNWFFRLSKFSLPFLEHPLVPPSRFLDEIEELPDNLDDYVLKPLYSFAGTGVIVGPTTEEIDAIPNEEREAYILQERVPFDGVIETPTGLIRAELRIMLVWPPDAERPTPIMSLVRTGQGDKMGVDESKGGQTDAWVGATCAFFESE